MHLPHYVKILDYQKTGLSELDFSDKDVKSQSNDIKDLRSTTKCSKQSSITLHPEEMFGHPFPTPFCFFLKNNKWIQCSNCWSGKNLGRSKVTKFEKMTMLEFGAQNWKAGRCLIHYYGTLIRWLFPCSMAPTQHGSGGLVFVNNARAFGQFLKKMLKFSAAV